jgi:hypothetical protein
MQPRLAANPDAAIAVGAPNRSGNQCFELTPAVAVAREVTDLAVVAPSVTGSPWSLTIGLMPAESSKISTYTASHHAPAGQDPSTIVQDPSEYLVVLAVGYVVEAAAIEAQLDGTVIQVSVDGGKAEADALVTSLTGK